MTAMAKPQTAVALEKALGAGLVATLHHELDVALSKLKPAMPEEN